MKKILGIGLLSLFISGCDSNPINEEKKISQLTLSFEGSIENDNVFIIIDKKTNVRYLFVKSYDGRGGRALIQMKD